MSQISSPFSARLAPSVCLLKEEKVIMQDLVLGRQQERALPSRRETCPDKNVKIVDLMIGRTGSNHFVKSV